MRLWWIATHLTAIFIWIVYGLFRIGFLLAFISLVSPLVTLSCPPVRLFDCFGYSSEALTLLIRLRTLSSVVTVFTLDWSNVTFSGRHGRSLTFAPFETEIATFFGQLFPLYIDMSKIDPTPWARARSSRHILIEGVNRHSPRGTDLVMLSDVDEIPYPSVLRGLLLDPPKTYVRLRAHFYYYSLRFEAPGGWIRNFVIRYSAIDRPLGNYRGAQGPLLPGFRAMHCSYCYGTIRDIIRELEAIQHTEGPEDPPLT
jgi:beta-1,4-mannosyl-glycoprotein beta-1,4-N-acetylglucosaminyltransferase